MKMVGVFALVAALVSGAAQADKVLTGTIGLLAGAEDILLDAGVEGLDNPGTRVAMGFRAEEGDVIAIEIVSVEMGNWVFLADPIPITSAVVAACSLFDYWNPGVSLDLGTNRDDIVIVAPYETLWIAECQWLAGFPQYVQMSAVLLDEPVEIDQMTYLWGD